MLKLAMFWHMVPVIVAALWLVLGCYLTAITVSKARLLIYLFVFALPVAFLPVLLFGFGLLSLMCGGDKSL